MALDGGINFFDTADIYSIGKSEEILGKALGKKRKDNIVASKVRFRLSDKPNDVGLSRNHIIEACDNSLKRLGTDYIDLYQVHTFDFHTPLEETLRALDDLVRQGKVRYIGCSNFAGWQLMKSLDISDNNKWERFITFQGQYSLLWRDMEYELAPLCLDQGLGIMCFQPLAGGFLTGKYRRGKPRPQGTRLSEAKLEFNEAKGYDIIDELDRIATAHSATVDPGSPQLPLVQTGGFFSNRRNQNTGADWRIILKRQIGRCDRKRRHSWIKSVSRDRFTHICSWNIRQIEDNGPKFINNLTVDSIRIAEAL